MYSDKAGRLQIQNVPLKTIPKTGKKCSILTKFGVKAATRNKDTL
jgi:hypothetical protein